MPPGIQSIGALVAARHRASTSRKLPVAPTSSASPQRRLTRWLYIAGMNHRVGAKGEVVIPKGLRDELNMKPGDTVTFWRHGDHVAVRPTNHGRPLRGRYAGSTLSESFLSDRNYGRG